MDTEAPSGVDRRGKRRWLRWFAVVLPAIPLAAFGLSNLVLGSAKGRAWIAARIQSRTTLETSIGGASWSPWNGVTVRQIRINQPEPLREFVPTPLAEIQTLNIRPVWKAALRGHLDIRRMTVEKPKIVLPLQLIAYFAPPTPPAVLAQNPTPPAITPSSPATPQPQAAPAPQQQPEDPPHTPPPAPTAPTDFIELKDASFSLVFAGHPTPLAEISGISGEIPVAGREAETTLSIASIHNLGNETARDLQLPLQWKAPLLTSPSTDVPVAGFQTKIAAQLGFVTGLPIAIEWVAPDQEVKSFTLPGNQQISSPKASSAFRFRGALLTPSTWHAESIATANKPVVTAPGHQTKFDTGRILAVLRGGTLSCLDARLTGDDISFLGNGTVFSDGRTAAVLRIVAPPETGMAVVRNLFPGVTSPPAFRSMSSPQRASLDIEVSGSLGDLQIRLGKNGPLVGQETPPASATPK